MLHYSESPPSLHHSPATSERILGNSRESTPLTPVGSNPSTSRKPDKEKGKPSHLPWFRRPIDIGVATTSLYIDSPLLEPDFDDHSFPLFGGSPPTGSMAGAAPIDIATRQASTSPRGHQPSNLTSALQQNPDVKARAIPSAKNARSDQLEVVAKSITMGEGASPAPDGTKPISMRGVWAGKERRESIPQSLTNGMSWGGISVDSWVRDDIMSGTSPFTFRNSPSYHSSSYLPKLEANYMRDFSCCGMTLPSLHDLLQHYEEAHAQKPVQPPKLNVELPGQNSAALVASGVNSGQPSQREPQSSHFQPIAPAQSLHQPSQMPSQPKPPTFASNLQTIPDIDTLDDMEMDDIHGTDAKPSQDLYNQTHSHDQSPHLQFNQAHRQRAPQLNMNLMQAHQALRNSTPTTPVGPGRQGFAFQNNPTVSSVNTPTLMTNPMQTQFPDPAARYRSTPDSSAPGTPAELDESIMSGMGDMSMHNPANHPNAHFALGGLGMGNDMLDLCIDEPAKRLFSPTGGYGGSTQQVAQSRLGGGQYGANSDIARRIREQQMLAGLPDTVTGMTSSDEPKPFRCPVIGCEKAYKNQNGLKYHKSHGHNNQRLHDNADGTFSIVNPETSIPYEGTLGMEKEKPYKCDACGKRYKNLNGLKYHKTHSAPCNPDLQNGSRPSSSGLVQAQGHTSMGAGLSEDAGIF